MLSENETVISFVPGSVTINNKTKKVTSKTLGQIVVHDRIKVESDILPRYFNHSSFASLRRQLNYFSFTRIGKGRQKGAVYCNEGVIEIDDILRLRRRPAQTTTGATGSPLSTSTMWLEEDGVAVPAGGVTGTVTPSSSVTSSSTTTKKRRSSLLSCQENRHQPVSKKSRVTSTTGSSTSLKLSSSRTLTATTTTTTAPKVVSPRTSPLHSSTVSPTSSVDGGELRIILDLTIPPPQQPELNDTGSDDDHYCPCNNQNHHNHDDDVMVEDEDVLAGCQALLSFAQGRPSVTA
jgi:hypothetical protein